MKKRLMTDLAAAGLVAAMLPSVTLAENPPPPQPPSYWTAYLDPYVPPEASSCPDFVTVYADDPTEAILRAVELEGCHVSKVTPIWED